MYLVVGMHTPASLQRRARSVSIFSASAYAVSPRGFGASPTCTIGERRSDLTSSPWILHSADTSRSVFERSRASRPACGSVPSTSSEAIAALETKGGADAEKQ